RWPSRSPFPAQVQVVDPETGAVRDPLHGVKYAIATPDPDRLVARYADGSGGFYDLSRHAPAARPPDPLPLPPTALRKGGKGLFLGDGTQLHVSNLTTGAAIGPSLHFSHVLNAAAGDPSDRRFLTTDRDGVHVHAYSDPKASRLIPDSNIGAIGDRVIV